MIYQNLDDLLGGDVLPMARPMPLFAPVTIATLGRISIVISIDGMHGMKNRRDGDVVGLWSRISADSILKLTCLIWTSSEVSVPHNSSSFPRVTESLQFEPLPPTSILWYCRLIFSLTSLSVSEIAALAQALITLGSVNSREQPEQPEHPKP